MDRYAVIGNPVGHSKSPRIHAAFAAQFGHALTYSALLSPRDAFAHTLATFLRRGGRGVNVTVPFKLDAFRCVDILDRLAQGAGAVNTILVLEDGRLSGSNTDGVGLVRDLTENLGCVLEASRVLVIGAGGATRGIVLPLLDSGVREITILNRTRANAEALVRDFGRAEIRVFDGAHAPFDVVLNASSAGLGGNGVTLPDGIADRRSFAYDLSYGVAARPFLAWAASADVREVHDGLGMLVEQAAESYRLWRGVRPRTRGVIQELREVSLP